MSEVEGYTYCGRSFASLHIPYCTLTLRSLLSFYYGIDRLLLNRSVMHLDPFIHTRLRHPRRITVAHHRAHQSTDPASLSHST